jgi:dTMP kinase
MGSIRGELITFEGIDGSGKSSACQSAKDFLEGQGIKVIVTRQPGGSTLGNQIREILKHHPEEIDPATEVLLLSASFRQAIKEEIEPNLKKGTWVLCDRFTDSTIAYQCGGKALSESLVMSLLKQTIELTPSLTLYYDLPAQIGLKRAAERGMLDNFEKRGESFQEQIRQKYLKLAEKEPERIKIVDTIKNNELESKELTTKFLKEHLNNLKETKQNSKWTVFQKSSIHQL